MKKILFILAFAFAMFQVRAQYAAVKVGGGYTIGQESVRDQAAMLDVVIGFQVRDYLYVGMITGVQGPVSGSISHDGVFAIPMLADVTLSIPNSTRVQPILDLAFGYQFGVVHTKFTKPDYDEAPGFVRMHAMPGMNIRLNDRYALEVVGGYTKLNHSLGDYGLNTLSLGGKISLVVTLF